jgi:hypothetical protein
MTGDVWGQDVGRRAPMEAEGKRLAAEANMGKANDETTTLERMPGERSFSRQLCILVLTVLGVTIVVLVLGLLWMSM